jgi:hypothetical protein
MPYLSDKGRDNQVEQLTSLTTFLKEKGLPVFKRHGQAIYNVINWLRGGGQVFGMRLMPDDASYANSVLNVKTKSTLVPVYKKKADGSYEKDLSNNRIPIKGEDGTPITTNGVEIILEIKTLSGLTSKSNIKAEVEALAGTVDTDGYTNHPILVMAVKGRGDYGNKYSYRLTLNTSMEDTYDFRVYDLSILERTKNGNMVSLEGPFQVSLFPEAVSIAGSSMFIGQVVSDYSKEVDFVFNEAAYDELVDSIMEATKSPDGYVFENPQAIDFIFGRNKRNELEEVVVVGDGVNVDHFEGIVFEKGSDGSFSAKNADRNEAIQSALVNAFTGLIDAGVLNKKKYPLDVVLDANFPIPVKNAIAEFCSERKDVFGVLDTGVLASSSSALAWRANEFQNSSIYCGIFGQSFSVYDAFTSMDIPVTSTYFLANKIPYNDAQYGVQFPFVGPNRGLIAGFKSLDWNPNEYEKEDLYKARINYVEQDFRNTKFMSQLTTQFKTSSLSNINNVRVLLKMIRKIEELAENFYFEFPDQSTLNSFNSSINSSLSEWTNNGACSVARGSAYQNEYDKDQKIARVRIEVVFNNVIERILMEFNIGK